jgi:hypothetical protein
MTVVKLLTLLALWNLAIGASIFVAVYHALARWWESSVGQNIMLLMSSLAAVCDLALLNIMLGRPDWMGWIFFVLYVVIGVAIWWRVGLVIKAQRRPGNKIH